MNKTQACNARGAAAPSPLLVTLARVFLALAVSVATAHAAVAQTAGHRPVAAVADARLAVGGGELPLYLSRDWSAPLPGLTRAVIVVHGVLRNADVYLATALAAQAAASAGGSSLIIAPQFLDEADVAAHRLPPGTLRWSPTGWEGGEPARGPAPISSFAALDAILARLADRRLFPDLKEVVVAGHSGGGQVVQRYAIATRGEAPLTAEGIAIRYVVANPSSYAWFGPERPLRLNAAACLSYNDWKYGMERRPPYLAGPTPTELEAAYVARRVIYLLGTDDTDPAHPALDKTCMAEAQGPTRWARGHAYFAAMQARDAGTPHHSLWPVEGVGHDGKRMFTSPCGLAALFDAAACR